MLNLCTALNPETFPFTNRLPLDIAQCYSRTSISASFATKNCRHSKKTAKRIFCAFLADCIEVTQPAHRTSLDFSILNDLRDEQYITELPPYVTLEINYMFHTTYFEMGLIWS